MNQLETFEDGGGVFVIGYDRCDAIACGALRPLSDAEVELKRMYVIESHRRKGIASQLLGFLEETARTMGYKAMMLETGDAQRAAIRLYESSGYQRIPAFGEYIDGPRSVCFAKRLERASPSED